jgi:hypothetical protein
MMLYSIDNLSLEEVRLMRQSLNVIQITGNSAQFVANLQVKLDNDILQIENFIAGETQEMEASFKTINKSLKGK